jgi:hypothetical protein
VPVVSQAEAVDRLAKAVQKVRPDDLVEVYSELFPEKILPPEVSVADIVSHIRGGLEVEEVVDLWNVVFPDDRNLWYDEEADHVHFNEEVVGYAD